MRTISITGLAVALSAATANSAMLAVSDDALVIDSAAPPTDLHATDNQSIRHDTPEEVVAAATAHEAVRQYQYAVGEPVPSPWAELDGISRAQAIGRVRNIQSGAAKSPEELHERTVAVLKDGGWTYGPQLSFADKTHPGMVEYRQLHPSQRLKNRLFFAIVSTLVGVAG